MGLFVVCLVGLTSWLLLWFLVRLSLGFFFGNGGFMFLFWFLVLAFSFWCRGWFVLGGWV